MRQDIPRPLSCLTYRGIQNHHRVISIENLKDNLVGAFVLEAGMDRGRVENQQPAYLKEQAAFNTEVLPGNISIPTVSVPKGGGAIRGVGEKFQANPITGTASVSVPIQTSPGREGFGPSLSFSYDSGNGNGPFGFGWTIALPSITRSSSKRLPQYRDSQHSDVFTLSGLEDLVPLVDATGVVQERVEEDLHYVVHSYKPRIESSFSQIERWTSTKDASVHWRQLSAENVLTVYGLDETSRIYNSDLKHQVWSWLVSEIRDVKGNCMLYKYKAEDDKGTLGHSTGNANRYLKSIYYGNSVSMLDDSGERPVFLDSNIDPQWHFQILLDYGEHDNLAPTTKEVQPWPCRADPFSTFRSGFEIRTSRLCSRVLMFHHFKDEHDVGLECLVKSTNLTLAEQNDKVNPGRYSFVSSIQHHGYRRKEGGYVKASMPSVDFEYSLAALHDELQAIGRESLVNFPGGFESAHARPVDLFGEGIGGILFQNEESWYYKRNITPLSDDNQTPQFADIEHLPMKPNLISTRDLLFLDLSGDGRLSIVDARPTSQGFFLSDSIESWLPFSHFQHCTSIPLNHPTAKLIDLNGDGASDLVLMDTNSWHPSLWRQGFDSAKSLSSSGEDIGGLFANNQGSYHLADFSGDGLQDIVCVRNGSVSYLPNLGYGCFGPRIWMENAPVFDHDLAFNPKHLIFADIDGSGTTDIIYLGFNNTTMYFNQSGNSWSEGLPITSAQNLGSDAPPMVLDLMGNGTQCLVYSNPSTDTEQVKFVNLTGSLKPHLLTRMSNNMGLTTTFAYASSVKFYLTDKLVNETPWICSLPFPIQVLESVETVDHISKNAFVSRFAYHHGYFDAKEREFRGFGMVEQWDSESVAALDRSQTQHLALATNQSSAFSLPPVHTKTWFHLGNPSHQQSASVQYEQEYFNFASGTSLLLPDAVVPSDLNTDEYHDTYRALKGSILRQEIYADDAESSSNNEINLRAATPYSISESTYAVKLLQGISGLASPYAVSMLVPRETITMQLERSLKDPPRIAHRMFLEINEFGQVCKELAVSYGRDQPDINLSSHLAQEVQMETFISYTERTFTNPVVNDARFRYDYHLPVECQSKAYQVTGLDYAQRPLQFNYIADKNSAILQNAEELAFDEEHRDGVVQKRVLTWNRTLLRADDLEVLLPLGNLQPKALSGQSYSLVMSDRHLSTLVSGIDHNLDSSILSGSDPGMGGYIHSKDLVAKALFPPGNEGYWIPSTRGFFSDTSEVLMSSSELQYARDHFYLISVIQNSFNATTRIEYDKYKLYPVDVEDGNGNRTTVGAVNSNGQRQAGGFDYRTLQPSMTSDINRNRTEVAFDALGMVVGQAVCGKPEEAIGDSLVYFEPDLDDDTLLRLFRNPTEFSRSVLAGATSRVIYDLFAFSRTRQTSMTEPVMSMELKRLTHASEETEIHHSIAFLDGYQREIQKKVQTNVGPVARRFTDGTIQLRPDGQPHLTDEPSQVRWINSGWKIYNNKGNPVCEFEPYFTDLSNFEFDIRVGVTKVQFFDALSRPFASLLPNNTFTKTTWTSWSTTRFDSNDTILLDPRTDIDLSEYSARFFSNVVFDTWLAQRENALAGSFEQQAALKTLSHANTPTIEYLDSAGHIVLRVSQIVRTSEADQNGIDVQFQYYRSIYNLQGKPIAIYDRDAQNGSAGRLLESYEYDMLGRVVKLSSLDSGTKLTIYNALNLPMLQSNNRRIRFRLQYDSTGRPTHRFVKGDKSGTTDIEAEVLVERKIYGETVPSSDTKNLRGQVVLILDQSGSSSVEELDFKGNIISTAQRLATGHKMTLDWSSADEIVSLRNQSTLNVGALNNLLDNMLDPTSFQSTKKYGATNQVLAYTSPASSSETQSTFRLNYEMLELVSIDCNIRNATDDASGDLVWTPTTKRLEYDARGKRTLIEYGNNVLTSYQYGASGELVQLKTVRLQGSGRTDVMQDLRYTYDPSFNITNIQDMAQQTLYYRGTIVQPSKSFTYDSLYRLIATTGREHIGQNIGAPDPHGPSVSSRTGPQPGDASAMATYLEQYTYDTAGNMLKIKHMSSNAIQGTQSNDWTRIFTYNEASAIQQDQMGNRLTSTSVGNLSQRFIHDAAGNTIYMPHLNGSHLEPNIHWDFSNNMKQVDLGGGGTAFYVYDHSGQRVKKIVEKGPNLIEERIYLSGTEVFSRIQSGKVVLQRETLHATSDNGSIALIETRTIDLDRIDKAPRHVLRFQHSDHLRSCSVETDMDAKIISFEEFSSFGSTTYLATDTSLELPKRYRFTSKERDDETGLGYFGSRFYADWLCRWVSGDPGGLNDGPNTYSYVSNNPVRLIDPSGEAGIEPGAEPWRLAIEKFAASLNKSLGPERGSKIYESLGSGRHYQDNLLKDAGKNVAATELWLPNPSGARRGGARVDAIIDHQWTEIKRQGVDRIFDTPGGKMSTSGPGIEAFQKGVIRNVKAAERQQLLLQRGSYNQRAADLYHGMSNARDLPHTLEIGVGHSKFALSPAELENVHDLIIETAKAKGLGENITINVRLAVNSPQFQQFLRGLRFLGVLIGVGAVLHSMQQVAMAKDATSMAIASVGLAGDLMGLGRSTPLAFAGMALSMAAGIAGDAYAASQERKTKEQKEPVRLQEKPLEKPHPTTGANGCGPVVWCT